MEHIYINNEGSSNKFWSYEQNGSHVTFKWGRVGGTPDSQTKRLYSETAAQSLIESKIREKTKKGYKLVSKDTLKAEESTANSLGLQNKISRMLFVNKRDTVLNKLDRYDSNEYVYVEILNSWSKSIVRLLLSKNESFQLNGGITETSEKIGIGVRALDSRPDSDYVNAVREVLRRTSQQVSAALKTVKFAALGVRSLFDDDNIQSPEVSNVLSNIDTASVDRSVLSKFASLGVRALDI